MGKAYFVAAKNEYERLFLETCVDRKIVSSFSPVGDISLDNRLDHASKVSEITYYVNAIASQIYRREEWREFREKIKDLAFKYKPDLEDFDEYESSKRINYPY